MESVQEHPRFPNFPSDYMPAGTKYEFEWSIEFDPMNRNTTITLHYLGEFTSVDMGKSRIYSNHVPSKETLILTGKRMVENAEKCLDLGITIV